MTNAAFQFRPEVTDLKDSQIVDVWKMGFSLPDVIGLWVGESDLPTPDFICEAASQAKPSTRRSVAFLNCARL